MSNAKKFWRDTTAFLLAVIMVCCSLMYSPDRAHAAAKKKTGEDDLKKMSEEVIWLVNEARAEENERIDAENIKRAEEGLDPLPRLKPLKSVPYLNDKARERSREIIFKFSHYRPRWDGGEDDMDNLFITIIDDNLIPYNAAAENIAAGGDNALATFNQWKDSPSHWKAILSPDYTHIGVGCSYEKDSTYGYYWAQLFITYDKESYGPLDEEYIPERYATVPKSAGDINGDGEINSYDLVTLRKAVTGQIELNDLQRESADLLKDGSITAADITVLKRYICGVYRTLPITMDLLPPKN
ncbi:MAG: SCP-like extracellular [Ruminococcus sp.]|nr:SCP-like extracellular [Ruminococcus sp.]